MLFTFKGGKILCGGKVIENLGGNFVQPTITAVSSDAKVLQHEVFVPILHTIKFKVYSYISLVI